MKQVLKKEDVAKAMADLIANGKKPTLNAIHAAVGGRGSTSTLIKLKAEIDAAANALPDSDIGLQTFREIWALAMDEGRKQNEAKVNELTANIQVVCLENEHLEGEAIKQNDLIASLETEKFNSESESAKIKAELEAQLNRTQAALIEAGDRARQAFEQLAQIQTAHAAELAALQVELKRTGERAHAAEIELAASKARLEAKG
jgi:hypothetical protein